MAKDTSRKIKGAFRAKFLNGERGNYMAPFGYAKHPDIKNKLIIDEETAWIVRRIFDLAFHGMGANQISKVLMDEKVLCPGWFQYSRNGGCARFFEDQPDEKRYVWSKTQIKNILKDETYVGNTVHHRQGTVSYKNKKVVRNPQEKWLRVEVLWSSVFVTLVAKKRGWKGADKECVTSRAGPGKECGNR